MLSFKELMFFSQQGILGKSCIPSILFTTNFSAQFKYLFTIIGVNDLCRCFFCGGGLEEWEAGDDPWAEHARWFPSCDFVRNQQQAELVKKTHIFVYTLCHLYLEGNVILP